MTFPQLVQFTDVVLLLLRLMIGAVFITSGYEHLKDPEARSKSIGMSKGFTIFLGAVELAGGLGVVSGVFAQLAAVGCSARSRRKYSSGTVDFGAKTEKTAGATTR